MSSTLEMDLRGVAATMALAFLIPTGLLATSEHNPCEAALAPLTLEVSREQRAEAASHWQLRDMVAQALSVAREAIDKFQRIRTEENTSRATMTAVARRLQDTGGYDRDSEVLHRHAEALLNRAHVAFDTRSEMPHRIEAMQTLVREAAYEEIPLGLLDEYRSWLANRVYAAYEAGDAAAQLTALRSVLDEAMLRMRVEGLPVHEYATTVGSIMAYSGHEPSPVMVELLVRFYEHAVRQSRHYHLFVSDVEGIRSSITGNVLLRWTQDAANPHDSNVSFEPEFIKAFQDAVQRIDARLLRLHLPEGHDLLESHVAMENGRAVGVAVRIDAELMSEEETIVDEELIDERAKSQLPLRRYLQHPLIR